MTHPVCTGAVGSLLCVCVFARVFLSLCVCVCTYSQDGRWEFHIFEVCDRGGYVISIHYNTERISDLLTFLLSHLTVAEGRLPPCLHGLGVHNILCVTQDIKKPHVCVCVLHK